MLRYYWQQADLHGGEYRVCERAQRGSSPHAHRAGRHRRPLPGRLSALGHRLVCVSMLLQVKEIVSGTIARWRIFLLCGRHCDL